MNTKLAINLSEGSVQVEGDEEFVRFIYQEFKDSLSKHALLRMPPVKSLEQVDEGSLLAQETIQPNVPAARKKTPSNSGEKSRTSQAKPKYNSKLDLAGLANFYDQWKPEKIAEKILVFAVFLRDQLHMEPCSSDDIYTCFFALKAKTKIPEAFKQAFIDTRNKTHYIEYDSLSLLKITIAGDNWFTEQANKLKESPQ